MKRHHLKEQERLRLDSLVAEAEKRTGAQIVLAVIERSDVYAELPWKAFALGASAAGLVVVLLDLLRPDWITSAAILLAVAATLAVGAVCALAAVHLPGFARIFLDSHRAEVEVRQYAQSIFLSRELFATRGRTGILLLVSFFERQVVILPDSGIAERLNHKAQKDVLSRMTVPLAAGQVNHALEEGLAALERALSGTAPAGGQKNELPDEVIEEKGV